VRAKSAGQRHVPRILASVRRGAPVRALSASASRTTSVVRPADARTLVERRRVRRVTRSSGPMVNEVPGTSPAHDQFASGSSRLDLCPEFPHLAQRGFELFEELEGFVAVEGRRAVGRIVAGLRYVGPARA
jgi:hypothetical protein